MREEAGRERREKERANTMLNVNEWNEVFRLVVVLELALQCVRQCKKLLCRAEMRNGGVLSFCSSDVRNLGVGSYHSPTHSKVLYFI